ncbi:hypothetical protein PFISCL1PPCAC_9932, partial [Pristionchus fissidentatus]
SPRTGCCCCTTISCKLLVTVVIVIHIVANCCAIFIDVVFNMTNWIDAIYALYMVILMSGLYFIHSRSSIPLYICAIFMTLWFVFFLLMAAFFAFSAFSAAYALYNFESTTWNIGGLTWRTGPSTDDFIAVVVLDLLAMALCLMIAPVHFKTASSLVAIGRYNGDKIGR